MNTGHGQVLLQYLDKTILKLIGPLIFSISGSPLGIIFKKFLREEKDNIFT
jgi:hypothetical protein